VPANSGRLGEVVEIRRPEGTEYRVLSEVTAGDAIEWLEHKTTDYSIFMRDWPRLGFRYHVRATRFFSRGSGLGSTLGEATYRALRALAIDDNRMPRVTWGELEDLLEIKDDGTDTDGNASEES